MIRFLPSLNASDWPLVLCLVGMAVGWTVWCGPAWAQTDLSPEALQAEALVAFEEGDWELAHRRLAELLSLDGTNRQLQVKYAATLLHDSRLREEGIQRLASLAHEEELEGEGWYWWGRALMLQGEGGEAEAALTRALSLAGKKESWASDCELALRQSQNLPTQFASRQALSKRDVVEVPRSSYHRYVQWDREGVRVMLVPQELQSKLDAKREVVSPVTFWRGSREVFYHSFGNKDEAGLDLWVGTLDEEGEFSQSERLPDHVNSSETEMNPVWDQEDQCLYFSSNRPGTVGGMDLWKSCRLGQSWTPAESLGPLYNSVHDDWAYYPSNDATSGWLLTGREAAYGGTQVWEVVPNGPPSAPVLLTTLWEVDGEVIPGTLTLSDAETNQPLARLDITEALGSWDLTVGSGQVVRYSFLTRDGDMVEGTYALPSVGEASSVAQRMVMTTVDGTPYLDARPLTKTSEANRNLAWGWNLVTDEVVVPEFSVPVLEDPVSDPVLVQGVERPLKQFQSYPWWTEVQREERALAANVLTAYSPVQEGIEDVASASEFGSIEEYEAHLSGQAESLIDEAVEAVMALAASDVILNETPWKEALDEAMLRAESLWPVGTLDAELVARQAKRRWARSGSLYDQGLLPEVRDKEGLVGDGSWVELPWERGDVEGLALRKQRLSVPRPEAIQLVWALANQPDATEAWGDKWLVPERWDVDAVAKKLQDNLATRETILEGSRGLDLSAIEVAEWRAVLNDVRTRMSILEAMETTALWTDNQRGRELKQWMSLALSLTEALEIAEEPSPNLDNTELLATQPGENPNPSGNEEMSDSRALQREWVEAREGWIQSLSVSNLRKNAPVAGKASEESLVSLAAWLQGLDESCWNPEDLLNAVNTHWQSIGASSEETSLSVDWREDLIPSIESLSQALIQVANAGLEESEAFEMVVSSWVLAQWRHDPDWAERTPDEVWATTDSWHSVARKDMQAWSVQWAKRRQQSDANSNGTSDEDVATDLAEELENSSLRALDASESGDEGNLEVQENQASAGPSKESEASEVFENARGLHLGWFRNSPNLVELPVGTRLASQVGSQGLTRWVLVLPPDVEGKDMASIQTWATQTNIADAYEVLWLGGEWLKPEDEGIPSVPTNSTRTETEETVVEDSIDDELKGVTTSKADSSSSQQEETSALPDIDKWGKDDVWAHGAPVELGNLMGTWYAVQVGAFRGVPEKEWIEQAGERLVYEPFPDGLARWYAGVRQDYPSSQERCDELKEFARFADAFVVRLRNGEREVIRPGAGLEEEEVGATERENSSAANEDSPIRDASKRDASERDAQGTSERSAEGLASEPMEVGETRAQRQVEEALLSEGQRKAQQPAETAPSIQVGADLARQSSTSPAQWRIDISKYYGTVPSKDVAVLLFRAADWGVRSVELFGQTTYSSRTFSDLAEAERVLSEVRREGFGSAKLIKEE